MDASADLNVARYVCSDCGYDSGLIVVKGTLIHNCQRKAQRVLAETEKALEGWEPDWKPLEPRRG